MMQSDPATLYAAGGLLDPAAIQAPSISNHMIYYIVNNGSAANSVQPWSSANTYADDEICNDGYSSALSLTTTSPNVRCALTTLPTNSYTSYNSTLPFNGTTGAINYKWVRIAPKVNQSVQYLQIPQGSTTATLSYYDVNSGQALGGIICWDGAKEQVLSSSYTNCPAWGTATNDPMNPVYVLTALGVGSGTNARKMVQSEAVLQPTTPFIYGLYATSNACPAISFNGNNASTNSYTTANGGTYATTNSNTGGDIGSNGGIDDRKRQHWRHRRCNATPAERKRKLRHSVHRGPQRSL